MIKWLEALWKHLNRYSIGKNSSVREAPPLTAEDVEFLMKFFKRISEGMSIPDLIKWTEDYKVNKPKK